MAAIHALNDCASCDVRGVRWCVIRVRALGREASDHAARARWTRTGQRDPGVAMAISSMMRCPLRARLPIKRTSRE